MRLAFTHAMAPDRYSVRMTTCARHQFSELSSDLRMLALRRLLCVAELAAQVRPPSAQMLRDAHIEPPVLRLAEWPLVMVYETDSERRMLTVLHVLCGGEPRSSHAELAAG